MEQVEKMLNYLHSHKPSDGNTAEEFELRWAQLKPRDSPAMYSPHDHFDVSCSPGSSTSFYPGPSDFQSVRDTSGSPHPSLGYDSDFSHPAISPSLQNLRGSLDDLKADADLGDIIHPPCTSSLSAVSAESLPSDSVVTWPTSSLDASASWTAISRSADHDKEVSPFTREVHEVIRKLDEDLERECPSSEGLSDDATTRAGYTILSDDQGGPSSLLYSEVDCDSFTNIESDDRGRLNEQYDSGTSSDNGDEEDLSWRKIVESSNEEPGKITRIIREKSQSVQDFLKLTVIDSESGSDSDGTTNATGSAEDAAKAGLGSAQVCPKGEKETGGEEEDVTGNRRANVPEEINDTDVIAHDLAATVTGDGLANVHAQPDVPNTCSSRNIVHDAGEQVSPCPPLLSLGTVCTESGSRLPSAFDCHQPVLDTNLSTFSSPSSAQEVKDHNNPTVASCTNTLLVSVIPTEGDDGAKGDPGRNTKDHITDGNLVRQTGGSDDHLPRIVIDDLTDLPLQDPPSLQEETIVAYRPRFGLNFRFVFKDGDDDDLPVGDVYTKNVESSKVPVETVEITMADNNIESDTTLSPSSMQWQRTSTPRTDLVDVSTVNCATSLDTDLDSKMESDVAEMDNDNPSTFVVSAMSQCEPSSNENYQTAQVTLVSETLVATSQFNISDLFVTVPESPLVDLSEDSRVDHQDGDVNGCQTPSATVEIQESEVTVSESLIPPTIIPPIESSGNGCTSEELFPGSLSVESEVLTKVNSETSTFSVCAENLTLGHGGSDETTAESELFSDSKPLTLSDLYSDGEGLSFARAPDEVNIVPINKDDEKVTGTDSGNELDHDGRDVDTISFDEGFDQSDDDDDRTADLSPFPNSTSVGEDCFDTSTESSSSPSPANLGGVEISLVSSHAGAIKQTASDQSSNSEDCFILVDLETNEAVLVDRPDSEHFGIISRVGEEPSASSSVVHPPSTQDTVDDAPGTGASSPIGWEYEGDDSDIRVTPSTTTDVSSESSQSSTSSKHENDPSQEGPEFSTGHDVADTDDLDDTSSSSFELISADEPSSHPVAEDLTAERLSESSSPSQERVHSKDDHSSEGRWVTDSPVKSTVNVGMIIDSENILQFEPSAELLLLMEASAKIERLVIGGGEGAASPRVTEQEPDEDHSPKSSPAEREDDDDDGSWTVGCVPPTSSPTCEANIAGAEAPSPQWETSADVLSSSSSCHSPSSTSSTSGEFDCSKVSLADRRLWRRKPCPSQSPLRVEMALYFFLFFFFLLLGF